MNGLSETRPERLYAWLVVRSTVCPSVVVLSDVYSWFRNVLARAFIVHLYDFHFHEFFPALGGASRAIL